LVDEVLLAQDILESGASGITISGGEPFLQARALCALIEEVRKFKDLGVCLYTGNMIEELEGEWEIRLLGLADVLVDGPYVEDLNDGRSLRGSSNQRVFDLTGRYSGDMEMYGAKGRRVELYVDLFGRPKMVGMPAREMLGLFWREEGNERG
jgi:anaerobic ribonucleoside-triphosphate reductase activating protein